MANTASSASSTKLTDAQLVLLSAASQREDSLVVLADVRPSVVRTLTALLRKKLLAELVVQRRQPHWRQDDNGKPIGLKLTGLGYVAIGADSEETKGEEGACRPSEGAGSGRHEAGGGNQPARAPGRRNPWQPDRRHRLAAAYDSHGSERPAQEGL